jgi:hypothetical protein
MAYSRPGVYVTEGPFSTNAFSGTGVVPASFVGTVARGPVTPTLVTSWNQYKTQFGDLTNASDLGYAVYQFFANGGRAAYVTRVYHSVSTGAASATDATAETTAYVGTVGGASTSVDIFKIKANSPGTWANYTAATSTAATAGLRVVVTAGLRNGVPEGQGGTGTPTTFNISVLLNGVEVERWREVSLDPDSAQFAPSIVNQYSNYISVDADDINASITSGVYYTLTLATEENRTRDLAGGTTSAPETVDWQDAVDRLDEVTDAMNINLVGRSDSTLVNYALAYAEGRGDCFVIIDPDKSLLSEDGIRTLVDGYSKSSYGAVYYPMLKMPDPARSGTTTLRDTYPGGAVAGLFSRVEIERTIAKAPAGYLYDLRNAFALAVNFTDVAVGTLYDANINTMKVVPGGGVIINGARTLKKTDITRYVPVRRSLNFIKKSVEDIAKLSLFEPNGERVWSEVSTRITRFLTDFWGGGGLKGRNASEAFFVVCDASNNTAYTMQNGELHVEVGVALQTPAEFIIINVTQFAGGSTTATEAV